MFTNTELINNYNLFLTIQNRLDTEAFQQIFGPDYKHYESKWILCENNLLSFMNMLDYSNKEKVFNWGAKIINHNLSKE